VREQNKEPQTKHFLL